MFKPETLGRKAACQTIGHKGIYTYVSRTADGAPSQTDCDLGKSKKEPKLKPKFETVELRLITLKPFKPCHRVFHKHYSKLHSVCRYTTLSSSSWRGSGSDSHSSLICMQKRWQLPRRASKHGEREGGKGNRAGHAVVDGLEIRLRLAALKTR